MKRINDIIYSIKLNYKSWLAFLLAIYFLRNNNTIFISILNFTCFFLFSYIAHYISHLKYFDFFTNIHKYHHKKNNWFSFITELMYEFVLSTLKLKVFPGTKGDVLAN